MNSKVSFSEDGISFIESKQWSNEQTINKELDCLFNYTVKTHLVTTNGVYLILESFHDVKKENVYKLVRIVTVNRKISVHSMDITREQASLFQETRIWTTAEKASEE